MGASFDVKGIDDLSLKIKRLANEYPEDTKREFKRVAYKLKNSCLKRINERTDEITGKLAKKGVDVSPVKGRGANLLVDIYGNQPHFHLIENGHEIIDPKTGENKGFVPGFNCMADTITEYREKYPAEMEILVERMIRKKGL